MASIVRRGRSWRAQVSHAGRRETATFPTKAQALAWAGDREAELRGGAGVLAARKSLADALDRYAREESPKHRGERWEVIRLAKLGRQLPAKKLLAELTRDDIASWRNAALSRLAPASVGRELGLLRAVLNTAVNEWGWLARSPAKGVKKPPPTPARRRRISADEVTRITAALGFLDDQPTRTVSQRVAIAFLFALESAMRCGEICALTRAHTHAKHVHLPRTKNADARDVPLSRRARALLELLPEVEEGPLFGLTGRQVDALFRRARSRAQIVDLHFHDSRAEAIWRLSKRLDVLELARMIGHRDPRSLMLYYETTAEELAERLG